MNNNIFNLPKDMVEEILSRIPLKSIRAVRSTCKKWSGLLKDESFTKKYRLTQEAASRADGEIIAIMLRNFKLSLMSFDLRGICNDESNDPSQFVKPKGKLFSLDDTYKLDFIRVCHCDGLLLCTTRDYTKLMVWNPYSGQTRWISVKPISVHHKWVQYAYAIGYNKRNHKILRFKGPMRYRDRSIHEILDLNSNSWRVLDTSPDCWIVIPHRGLSLKGNMYWYARVQRSNENLLDPTPGFLVCFDFTKEIFGPHLPLPFVSFDKDAVILSSLREERLAVLFHRNNDNFEMESWVTTKIEPDAVSWSKLFAIDMKSPTGYLFSGWSFLIDEEKRVVILFEKDYGMLPARARNVVYFIGENGYFKKVDLRKPISGMIRN